MKYDERFTSNLSQVDFSGKHLFIGIDMHKKNWVVTVRTRDLQLKTFSMDPFPETLQRLLNREYGGGIFHLVYEAGCFGYGSYDYFQEKELDIIVTPPNRLYRENSGVKTDKRDSRALALFLSKGLLRKVVKYLILIDQRQILTKHWCFPLVHHQLRIEGHYQSWSLYL